MSSIGRHFGFVSTVHAVERLQRQVMEKELRGNCFDTVGRWLIHRAMVKEAMHAHNQDDRREVEDMVADLLGLDFPQRASDQALMDYFGWLPVSEALKCALDKIMTTEKLAMQGKVGAAKADAVDCLPEGAEKAELVEAIRERMNAMGFREANPGEEPDDGLDIVVQ